jgi:predicted membrane metal-binding protein
VAGSIATVVLYAALGGSGPPAVRAAIMGTLLVLAPALGRVYNIFTALALAALVMTAVEAQGGSWTMPAQAPRPLLLRV